MSKKTYDDLLAWRVVQKMLRHGEITSAANQLDLDPPQASRLLRALEKDLGFRIFDRSSRPFPVTEQGRQVLSSMELLMETRQQLLNACRAARANEQTTKIVFGSATGTSSRILLRLINDYQNIDSSLEISFQNNVTLDEIREKKIHIGYFPFLAKERSLLCVPVSTVFMLSLASPIYLSRFGTPHYPDDLDGHTTLQRNDRDYPFTKGLWKHQFYRTINPKKTWRIDNTAAIEWACEGEGIALDIPLSMAEDAVRSGKLVPTIDGWHRQCWHYSLVCNYSVLMETPPLGNFIEWLMLKLQAKENEIWQTLYEECKQEFPIRSEFN